MDPNIQQVHVDKAKTNWLSKKMAGQPVKTPPATPVGQDQSMTAGIGRLLHRADDGAALTPEEEASARSMIGTMGTDILAAAEDSTSDQHALAHRILRLFIQFSGGTA